MLLGLSMCVVGIIAALFIPALSNSPSMALLFILGAVAIIIYIALIYFSFIFIIRRLHDKNQSGWLSLLMFIPLVNLFFFIYLSCAKGDTGANNYGAPRITQGWEKVLRLDLYCSITNQYSNSCNYSNSSISKLYRASTTTTTISTAN